MESANKNVQDLQIKAGAMSCNAVRTGGSESMGQKRESQGRAEKDKECYHCKGKHAPEDCWFKKEKCHACGMTGHIARVCRNKKCIILLPEWQKGVMKRKSHSPYTVSWVTMKRGGATLQGIHDSKWRTSDI